MLLRLILFSSTKQAISFKRKINIHKDEKRKFWRHIGVYAYTRNSLKVFSNAEPSENEIKYKLEQLRAFDLGMNIIVDEAEKIPGPDVDTIQDLEAVRRIFQSL